MWLTWSMTKQLQVSCVFSGCTWEGICRSNCLLLHKCDGNCTLCWGVTWPAEDLGVSPWPVEDPRVSPNLLKIQRGQIGGGKPNLMSTWGGIIFFFCIRTLSFWIMGRKFVPPFLRSSQPLQSHEPLFHNKPLSVSLDIWHWFHLLEGLFHVLLCDFSFKDNEYIPIHPNRALSTDHRSWVYLDELKSLLWLLSEA